MFQYERIVILRLDGVAQISVIEVPITITHMPFSIAIENSCTLEQMKCDFSHAGRSTFVPIYKELTGEE